MLVLFAAAAAVMALIGFAVWSVRTRRAHQHNLDQARRELGEQIRGVAQMVFDLHDQVAISASDDLELRYDEASVEFNDLEVELAAVGSGADMAALNDRVDRLRWRLEWIEARLEGRPAPPEPRTGSMIIGEERVASSRETVRARQGTCFFDPDHRPGTVPASIDAGSVEMEVLFCRECARTVEDGDIPEPRLLQAGSRRVPAARASLGFGGLGLEVPDRFRIVSRDSGRPISVDWSAWPSPAPSSARSEQLPRRSRRASRSDARRKQRSRQSRQAR